MLQHLVVRNVLEMTTQTFEPQQVPITIASGFDSTDFDAINFDVLDTNC